MRLPWSDDQGKRIKKRHEWLIEHKQVSYTHEQTYVGEVSPPFNEMINQFPGVWI
jgi:hypothetical protein